MTTLLLIAYLDYWKAKISRNMPWMGFICGVGLISTLALGEPAPDLITKKAYLWLDATKTTSLVLKEHQVLAWHDQRADKADLKLKLNGNAQLVNEPQIGSQPCVKFAAGSWLDFPDTQKIRTIFWVVRAEAHDSYLLGRLGGHAGYYDFHRNIDSTQGEIWDSRYAAPGILNGVTRVNGFEIDGSIFPLNQQFNLIALQAAHPLAANTLAADRSAARAGKLSVAELIIFEETLTAAQCQAIEQHLATKWQLQVYKVATPVTGAAAILKEWHEPAAPGIEGAAEETQRQWAMLAHDLTQRQHFTKYAAEAFCPEALITAEDHSPLTVLLRRTRALLQDLQHMPGAPNLDAESTALKQLEQATSVPTAPERRLFEQALQLRRKIAFANPLLDFNELLFIKRDITRVMQHCCDQFYGQQQHSGGGLFVLSNPFGTQPQIRNLLADSDLQFGTRRQMGGDGGSILSPAIDYDGQTIAFAYVKGQGSRRHIQHLDHARNGHWDEGFCYHIYTMDATGKGLKQLTSGTFNDFSPCFTPAGRIAFISERRGGYLRCGRLCPNYTMFDMARDGSDLRCLSFHETNEWSPAITHDGMLLWTRWDYVDRHGCTAHHPWLTTPDGRDPRPIHGNYSYRHRRADMELDTRAIPGSHKLVATGAPHHGQAFGSLVVIDPRIPDDDAMGPSMRLTPEIGFPESQGGTLSYGTAWPLSESYYLVAFEPSHVKAISQRRLTHDLYLLDKFGNKELIYRDPQIACLSPMPLRAQKRPPVIPEQRLAAVAAHARAASEWQSEARGVATITIADVYQSLLPWPEDGSKIVALRIWQGYPATLGTDHLRHRTGIQIKEGYDSVNMVRAVIGTVPIESDGSAFFEVPSGVEIFFQALDQNGAALQSMRSTTALVPGEQLSCQGCHEPKGVAPPPIATTKLLATQRAPSQPVPGPEGSRPFNYLKLVQPVLDKHCVTCHSERIAAAPQGAKVPPRLDAAIQGTFVASYHALAAPYGFVTYGAGQNWDSPHFYRTFPGQFGARASKLYALLQKGHHAVKLSDAEMQRIIIWLDSVSQFYGVYEEEGGKIQLSGGHAAPTLE